MKKVTSLFLALMLSATAVRATTELPGLYDARSTAMGGTGAAFIDSAAAIYNNPAALDQIQTLVVTADCTPARTQTEAPFMGKQYKSKGSVTPLFFVGGAYRVHERLVLGAAVYPTAGFGSTYEGIELAPGLETEIETTVGMFEFAVPVSIRLVDNLSIALMWRGTYLMQTATQPATDPTTNMPAIDPTTGAVVPSEMTLSGMNWAGFGASLFYRPMPALRLGLTYRSKVTTSLSGDIESAGTTMDVESEFAAPHQLRFGAALALLDNKLLLAADVKYLMYKDANETMRLTITTPAGEQESVTELHWKDSINGHVGIEYAFNEIVAGRLGYSIAPSATPEDYASLAATAPGLIQVVHAGAGFRVNQSFTIDVAFAYSAMTTSVSKQTENNSGPGDYGLSLLMGAVSATYTM